MGGIAMKQFSTEEYLKNPNRKVVTRDGKNARVICTDRVCSTHPVLALLFEDEDRDREEVYQYTSKGEYYPNASSPHDLFFVPVKKSGWINLYKMNSIISPGPRAYNTKKEAESAAGNRSDYISTIKIKWEE